MEIIVYITGVIVGWIISTIIFPDMSLPKDGNAADFITGMFMLPWIMIFRLFQVIFIASSWIGVISIIIYFIIKKIVNICKRLDM